MSTVKLTLRPPPNVEFVQGFPGIPPGAPDRPQAAVKGTIEVRVGPQGCKAKWVRIELKKVETLPGGGATNTFSDFVGPSPVNLWQSGEEYSMLPTQDFPFYIRIPESIPPSIALEKGAGIRYDLVATVCVKGKKGFLRRGKSILQSTQTTVFLDKHELHSTWPVYTQPESRHLAQEGVHLTVDRSRTCYGPGDRVSVSATLKSDSLHTVILRGFEFTLKETTIFRAGPHATGKNRSPLVRETILGEQKVPVNVTLYGGTQHKAELACVIPPNHTTTSLNAARHIDITYVIHVKALMGTGTHLIMDLPVIVSNWPRNVSVELVKRIGTAPSLSLGAQSHPTSTPSNRQSSADLLSNGSAVGGYPSPGYQPLEFDRASISTAGPYNTLPSAPVKSFQPGPDEFGYGRPEKSNAAATAPAGRSSTLYQDEFANRPVESRPPGAGRRPGTGNSTTARFTITNIGEADHELTGLTPPSTARSARTPWLPAEEEKKRLYERATAEVARVQGAAASPPVARNSVSPLQQSATAPRKDSWLSAEQEKTRLYEEAQATASRTQGAVQGFGYSPPPTQSTYPRTAMVNSEGAASGSHAKSSSIGQMGVSAGAALYQQAISSMHRNPAEQTLPSPPPSRGRGSSSPVNRTVPAYPSAEEEKAALKRYHEAKNAVDRTQGIQSPPVDLISYDTLYPSNNPSRSSSYNAPAPSGMPPPFTSSVNQSSNILSEKERLRRAYDAQDAVALSQQAPSYNSPPATFTTPHYQPPIFPVANGPLSEKELLRRKYEAEDTAAQSNSSPASPPMPPPRKPSLRAEAPPPAPIAGSSSILSAVEEKALLKARYEAEEKGSNGSPPPSAFPIRNKAPPPPLMPRPPVEYIQETQLEDARIRDSGVPGQQVTLPPNQNAAHELDLRPFTPFSVGINGMAEPGPPPPLPPKKFSE